MEKRDLRLYEYGYGTLKKVGSSRSKVNNSQRHFFDDIEQLKTHINWLKSKRQNTQFIIIEYFGTYNSKILEII